MPLPAPWLPELTRSHDALLVDVHTQSLGALTENVPGRCVFTEFSAVRRQFVAASCGGPTLLRNRMGLAAHDQRPAA